MKYTEPQNLLRTLSLVPDEWTQCFILWKIMERREVIYPCRTLGYLEDNGFIESTRIDGVTFHRSKAKEEKVAMGKEYEGVPSGPFKKEAPINLQIICHGWDSESQNDKLLPTVTVRVFADVGNSTGRAFDYECSDPMELWHYLRELTSDPYAMLQQHFQYQPPSNTTTTTSTIPDNLLDLFN